MTDSQRFLLGAPYSIDRDLIKTCGINLNVAERISITTTNALSNSNFTCPGSSI